MVQVKADATPQTLLLTLPIRCSISLLCATHLPTTSGRGDCEQLQDGHATRLRITTYQLRLGLKAGLFWVDVASPTLLEGSPWALMFEDAVKFDRMKSAASRLAKLLRPYKIG